jgi:hypothetical protein
MSSLGQEESHKLLFQQEFAMFLPICLQIGTVLMNFRFGRKPCLTSHPPAGGGDICTADGLGGLYRPAAGEGDGAARGCGLPRLRG